MAGSGIERMSRPMPSGSPAGACTLMPPHIQGAEQRAERRARWSLRALVLAGLAGAVWLLTGGLVDLQQQSAPVPASAARMPSLSTVGPVGEHPVVRRPGDERPAIFPRAHQAFRAGRAIRHDKHDKAAHRRSAVASAIADGPVPDRRDTRGDDGPLRLHPGESGGSAALRTATPMDGGCAAFLPATVADSTMACRRLSIATDVEARRHDAEAPTVSPD